MKRLFTSRSIYLLLAALLAGASASVSGQVRVTRFNDPSQIAGRKGIVYSLPRTALDVEMTVTKTQIYPGPLAEYAREFLGTGEVVTKPTTEYNLAGAELKSCNEPDPDQTYIIEKEEKSQGEIWVSFSQDGKMIGIDNFPKESSPKGFAQWDNAVFGLQDEAGLYPRYSASAIREKVDTIIRRVSIDTLMIEEKILKRSMVEYPDRDKAEEAADRIRRIDSDIYNLLIGYQETPYPKESLEFMYSKLQEERREYVSLFTGLTVKENLVFQFRVVPDPSRESQRYDLGGFSPVSGLVEAAGDNSISLVIDRDGVPAGTASGPSAPNPSGIVYRTPVVLPVGIEYQGKEITSGYFEILQFGALQSLPPEFKKVELDLERGLVRSVVME
jgi:hypothetical protein